MSQPEWMQKLKSMNSTRAIGGLQNVTKDATAANGGNSNSGEAQSSAGTELKEKSAASQNDDKKLPPWMQKRNAMLNSKTEHTAAKSSAETNDAAISNPASNENKAKPAWMQKSVSTRFNANKSEETHTAAEQQSGQVPSENKPKPAWMQKRSAMLNANESKEPNAKEEETKPPSSDNKPKPAWMQKKTAIPEKTVDNANEPVKAESAGENKPKPAWMQKKNTAKPVEEPVPTSAPQNNAPVSSSTAKPAWMQKREAMMGKKDSNEVAESKEPTTSGAEPPKIQQKSNGKKATNNEPAPTSQNSGSKPIPEWMQKRNAMNEKKEQKDVVMEAPMRTSSGHGQDLTGAGKPKPAWMQKEKNTTNAADKPTESHDDKFEETPAFTEQFLLMNKGKDKGNKILNDSVRSAPRRMSSRESVKDLLSEVSGKSPWKKKKENPHKKKQLAELKDADGDSNSFEEDNGDDEDKPDWMKQSLRKSVAVVSSSSNQPEQSQNNSSEVNNEKKPEWMKKFESMKGQGAKDAAASSGNNENGSENPESANHSGGEANKMDAESSNESVAQTIIPNGTNKANIAEPSPENTIEEEQKLVAEDSQQILDPAQQTDEPSTEIAEEKTVESLSQEVVEPCNDAVESPAVDSSQENIEATKESTDAEENAVATSQEGVEPNEEHNIESPPVEQSQDIVENQVVSHLGAHTEKEAKDEGRAGDAEEAIGEVGVSSGEEGNKEKVADQVVKSEGGEVVAEGIKEVVAEGEIKDGTRMAAKPDGRGEQTGQSNAGGDETPDCEAGGKGPESEGASAINDVQMGKDDNKNRPKAGVKGVQAKKAPVPVQQKKETTAVPKGKTPAVPKGKTPAERVASAQKVAPAPRTASTQKATSVPKAAPGQVVASKQKVVQAKRTASVPRTSTAQKAGQAEKKTQVERKSAIANETATTNKTVTARRTVAAKRAAPVRKSSHNVQQDEAHNAGLAKRAFTQGAKIPKKEADAPRKRKTQQATTSQRKPTTAAPVPKTSGEGNKAKGRDERASESREPRVSAKRMVEPPHKTAKPEKRIVEREDKVGERERRTVDREKRAMEPERRTDNREKFERRGVETEKRTVGPEKRIVETKSRAVEFEERSFENEKRTGKTSKAPAGRSRGVVDNSRPPRTVSMPAGETRKRSVHPTRKVPTSYSDDESEYSDTSWSSSREDDRRGYSKPQSRKKTQYKNTSRHRGTNPEYAIAINKGRYPAPRAPPKRPQENWIPMPHDLLNMLFKLPTNPLNPYTPKKKYQARKQYEARKRYEAYIDRELELEREKEKNWALKRKIKKERRRRSRSPSRGRRKARSLSRNRRKKTYDYRDDSWETKSYDDEFSYGSM